MSFSQVRITGNKSNPDFVYYNATVINNEVTTTAQTDDPPVTFQDTRQTPLVVDTSQYTVSVENFSMNGVTKTLPIFIPQVSGGVNDTIYTVTYSNFNGTTYRSDTQKVIWEPENKTPFTVVPTTFPPSNAQSESDYYYCYTYTHWVKLVNKALRTAWTNVSQGGTLCPFFEFDETTGLFSLNQDAKTSIAPVGTTLPAPFSVSFTATGSYLTGEYSFVGCNANLEGLLSNFESDYYADGVYWRNAIANGELPESVFNFGLTNLNSSSVAVGTDPVGVSLKTKPTTSNLTIRNPFTNAEIADSVFVRMTQDYISIGSLWSPISSFVISTNQIPVRSEFVAAPVRLGSDNLGGGGVNAAFQKVLLEVPINAITADLWRGWVMYEPLTPTKSSLDAVHDGLTQLDFSLYWRNRLTNSLIPCRIYNSGTFSLRLLFERRGL